jgi:hypothetical protein
MQTTATADDRVPEGINLPEESSGEDDKVHCGNVSIMERDSLMDSPKGRDFRIRSTKDLQPCSLSLLGFKSWCVIPSY